MQLHIAIMSRLDFTTLSRLEIGHVDSFTSVSYFFANAIGNLRAILMRCQQKKEHLHLCIQIRTYVTYKLDQSIAFHKFF